MLFLILVFALPAFSQAPVAWNFAGPAAPQARVLALAADSRNDITLYLGTPGGGVWKTYDSGGTWAPQTDSLPSLQVCSIVVDPQSSDTIYAGTGDDQNPRTGQRVDRSTNGGRTWTIGPHITNEPICALGIDPSDSTHLFAGSLEGLFVSNDSGASWTKVLNSPVTSIAFDGPDKVYVGTTDAIVQVSPDSGRTWSPVVLPLNPIVAYGRTNWVSVIAGGGTISVVTSWATAALVSGSASSPLIPFSQLDFYRSTDGGATWSPAYAIGQARPPFTLLADPIVGNLYVGGKTLIVSRDQGASWQTVPTTTAEFHAMTYAGGNLLLGGERGVEYVGIIEGYPVRSVAQLPIAQFAGVDIDPANGIWASGPSGMFGLMRTGTTPEIEVTGVRPAGTVVAAQTGSANIFVSTNSQVIYSNNAGVKFTAKTIIADGELRAPNPPMVIDPVTPSNIYVAGKRLYHTSNNGTTWTALSIVDPDPTRVVIALAMAPASRTTFFAATACLPEVTQTACPTVSLVWRSANAGQTWTLISTLSGLISKLAVDARQSSTLYAAIGAFPGGSSLSAGLAPGDLLQSTNANSAAATWTSIRANLPPVSINTILVDPTSLSPVFTQPAQRIYLGTDAGVFVSFGFVTNVPQWIDISGSSVQNLPPAPVTELALRASDGVLFAATFGRGVYWMNTTGLTAGIVVKPLGINVTLVHGTSTTSGVPLTSLSTTTTLPWKLSTLDPWITLGQTDGTLRPQASVQVPVVISAEALPPGSYRGKIQVGAGPFVQNIPVELRVTAAPAQIAVAGGSVTSGAPGGNVPLHVLLTDADREPLAGIAVSFTIISGGGSLNPRTAVSNSAGVATSVLSLPATAGKVQVVASSGKVSLTFTITVAAAPSLLSDGVLDGISLNPYASLAPGSIVSISGTNVAEADAAAPNNVLLPAQLLSTQVILSSAGGDIALPLLSVSSSLIKAFIPPDVVAGVYGLRVEVAGVRSNTIQISMAAYDPGIFTQNDSGHGLGIFVKSNGTIVSASNPADRGTTVTFYAAGLGAVSPAAAPGQPGAVREPLNRTVRAPRVYFDSYSATVTYSGLAQGLSGRYQVNVTVPAALSPATNISVSLTIGGFASNRVTIPVR